MILANGKLYHNISFMIVPFTGIYLVLFISKLLAPLVKSGSFIDKIGRNTLHIMANHLLIIFVIELIILGIDGKPFSELPSTPDNFYNFYKVEKYKYLYTFGSVIICTHLGEFLHYTKQSIKKNFNKLVSIYCIGKLQSNK